MIVKNIPSTWPLLTISGPLESGLYKSKILLWMGARFVRFFWPPIDMREGYWQSLSVNCQGLHTNLNTVTLVGHCYTTNGITRSWRLVEKDSQVMEPEARACKVKPVIP